jgi:hypothetical protein
MAPAPDKAAYRSSTQTNAAPRGNTKGKEFPFLGRGEFPLRAMNLPSSPYRYYIFGLLALSIAAKSREKFAR